MKLQKTRIAIVDPTMNLVFQVLALDLGSSNLGSSDFGSSGFGNTVNVLPA